MMISKTETNVLLGAWAMNWDVDFHTPCISRGWFLGSILGVKRLTYTVENMVLKWRKSKLNYVHPKQYIWSVKDQICQNTDHWPAIFSRPARVNTTIKHFSPVFNMETCKNIVGITVEIQECRVGVDSKTSDWFLGNLMNALISD